MARSWLWTTNSRGCPWPPLCLKILASQRREEMIIDGKAIAEEIRTRVLAEAQALRAKGIVPSLDVVMVGDDPGSIQYAKSKEKTATKLGIDFRFHHFPEITPEEEVIAKIKELSADPNVKAIMIEMPLPKHMNENAVRMALNPDKDVDGLHPVNLGKLVSGAEGGFIPNTPLAVIRIIDSIGYDLKGKRAVIIGRSVPVGKPLFFLMLARHATVTTCHTRTMDLPSVTTQADVLVAAAGKAGLVTRDMVKPGAVVIDVGTNIVDGKTVGDVDFEAVKDVAGMITPVPGGVGPVTTATLFENVIEATKKNS